MTSEEEGWENVEQRVPSFSYARWESPRDLLYGIMHVANNTLYLLHLQLCWGRSYVQYAYHKNKRERRDGQVSGFVHGDIFMNAYLSSDSSRLTY